MHLSIHRVIFCRCETASLIYRTNVAYFSFCDQPMTQVATTRARGRRHYRQTDVGWGFGAHVSAVVVGRGESLTLSILASSPAASGAAILLDLVSINYS